MTGEDTELDRGQLSAERAFLPASQHPCMRPTVLPEPAPSPFPPFQLPFVATVVFW